MNEAALQRPAMAGRSAVARIPARRPGRSSAFYGYSLLTILVGAGWLARDRQLINPEQGVGYWLGIVGGSLMLLLLLYPLRKRLKVMRRLGPTKAWFRMHMVLGLVGPLFILYHCNFQLGSFNSRVAFYSMLLVAGSGVIGRHFYERIHRGLYGRKTSLCELQEELAISLKEGRGLAKFMPNVVARLNRMSEEIQGGRVAQSVSFGRSIRRAICFPFVRISLYLKSRWELRLAVASGQLNAADFPRAQQAASRYIRKYTNLVGKVAQFSFYERMFAIWHVFHLPIFFMMVITALFHVLAVHMY